jgi:hypothetical protein
VAPLVLQGAAVWFHGKANRRGKDASGVGTLCHRLKGKSRRGARKASWGATRDNVMLGSEKNGRVSPPGLAKDLHQLMRNFTYEPGASSIGASSPSPGLRAGTCVPP